MHEPRWTAFPYPRRAYVRAGSALEECWGRLHRSDREPFPSVEQVAEQCRSLAAPPPPEGDPERLAAALQQAWRLFHQGRFQEAAEQGLRLGVLGHAVANKAAAIQVNYLEPDPTVRRALLGEVARRAEAAIAALPRHANSHYAHAYAIGRLGQGVSIMEALAAGHATRIRGALDATLRLDPLHADAHVALGTWHTEIVAKAGGLMGALTYGASSDAGIGHYRKALALAPESAIARIEHAGALLRLGGRRNMGEAMRLYAEAAAIEPQDAMERLDVEFARSRLEDDATGRASP